MKKRFLFPLLVSALALTGCAVKIKDFVLFGVVNGEFLFFTKIDSNNEETVIPDYEVDKTIIDNHYTNYDLTKTGGRLQLELQKYCFDKHVNWIRYGQINSYYVTTTSRDSTEAISKGSKINEWYYTGKLKEGTSGSNREHVWPCANSGGLWDHNADKSSPHYVDNTNYVGGGSDLYHVRLCESKVNTARGNSRFVSFDDPEWSGMKASTLEYGESGGKYTIRLYNYETTTSGGVQFAKQAEPADEMKGDVARLILYVYIHYLDRGEYPEGEIKSGYKYSDVVGGLSLSSVMGYNSEERSLEVLQAWNKLDPPSSVEKLRNDTVQKIQGNRNPFVDYPQLVDQLG